MKKKFVFILLFVLLLSFLSCTQQPENFKDAFTFIAAADMRFYATEKYRTSQHFLGAVEAIKRVGPGSLMISPGDTDPPADVREVIDQVLGKTYPWYPVAGNHELEDVAYMDWLRDYNSVGTGLPNIVRYGPPGCEETTYSFDYDNCHFVGLNQYYDGKSDVAMDGNIVPELLTWLENDLTENDKKFVFVYGHEPIVSIPDMDNGKVRHQGDSLDKYPQNNFAFMQLLLKYGVTAYICGHTHSTSYANLNGIWQFDVGHSRGIEESSAPEILYREIIEEIQTDLDKGVSEKEALKKFYKANMKQVKKTMYHARLAPGKLPDEYKKLTDMQGLQGLLKFYPAYQAGGEARQKIEESFWKYSMYRKSTFMKFYVGKNKVKVEIYRDDAHGGPYQLREMVIL